MTTKTETVTATVNYITKQIMNYTKEHNKILAKELQKQLEYSEQKWNEGTSHAQIIGYLQGTIKTAIKYLNDEL